MPTTKLLYWNQPWPGHVGLIIDMQGGEQTPAYMGLIAATFGVSPNVTAEIPIGIQGLRNYVSWTAGSQTGNALSGFRAYARTYEEDIIACGGGAHKAAEITGLNVDDMYEAWQAIRTKDRAHWKLLGKNCACVVLRVLRAGGCDALVPSTMKRNPAIITPQAVWVYAKSAAKHSGGNVRHHRQNLLER